MSGIEYETKEEFQNVFEYLDVGEHFYIILSGIVLVKIKNPTITAWKTERARFKGLLQWKNEDLEDKIDEAIKERFEVVRKLRKNMNPASLRRNKTQAQKPRKAVVIDEDRLALNFKDSNETSERRGAYHV